MKKNLLFFIVFTAINLYSKTNSIVPDELISTCVINDSQCYGSNSGSLHIITIGGQSPYTYSINNGLFQSMSDIFNLSAGTYTIITKDALGASVFNTVVIKEPTALLATAIVSGQDITLNATGGTTSYAYWLTMGSVLVANAQSSNTFSNLAPGTYTVNLKDSNGCLISIDAAVTSSLTSAVNLTKQLDCISNASLTVTAAGGQTPYAYSLNNGPYQSSDIFSDLSTGTYYITVKDAIDTTSITNTITIAPLSPLTIISTITNSLNCNNDNAIITATVAGGNAPYSYSFDGGTTYTLSNVFITSAPGTYSVFVKDSNHCIASNQIALIAPQPIVATATKTDINCYGDSSGTINIITSGGSGSFTYSLNGGVNQTNSNSSSIIFTNLVAGTYIINIIDTITGCATSLSMDIAEPLRLSATVVIESQSITTLALGGSGAYQYALEGLLYQSNPIFTDVQYGDSMLYIRDTNGCLLTLNTTVNPPAPIVNGKYEITFEFKLGQTLADIIIEGQNIKWYSNKSTSKTSKKTETTLPLTTVLMDGTTYYASQTINGIESTERLAVTTKSNGSLSTLDFKIPDFKYSPNPVKNILTINNTSTIDEIEIFSVLGKFVLSKKINADHSDIDLSRLSNGVYFLKIKSEDNEKTIKIVKE